MKRKNSDKPFEIIEDFKKILIKKPPLSQMIEEVRMMKFKIHPLSGNITNFNFNNSKLIEILWSLGKIDNLLQNKYKKLSTANKRLFIQALNEVFFKLEEQLKTASFKTENLSPGSSILELEVYKEQPTKLN